MMRPSRFGRRVSPTRKNRPRSISPLSRDRKVKSWYEPSNSRRRVRSRSGDRLLKGKDGNRGYLEDFRPKDTLRKGTGRLGDRTSADRNRDFYNSRIDDREKKHNSPASSNHGFDRNFGDHSRNIGHFTNIDRHNDLLDPSSIDFDPYLQQDERPLLEPPQPPQIEPYVRHSDRNENSSERIKRLEKLVEKLVEGNIKLPNQEEPYNQLSRDVPELIPSNTKFTTSMWLNRIHDECLKRGFDEKSIIQFTQDRMTGIIKSWFKSVSSYDFTWPELKMLITKTFPDNVDFANTLKLLVSRDKASDETITQYYFSKVYLCEACKITGENAVSCLIDGLTNPFMKQDIKSYKFLTPEALYSEYLSKFPENEIPVYLEQREVVPSYSKDDYSSMDTSKPAYRTGKPRRDREKPKCSTCKKIGHTTVECRHAPICYTCKKKGHIAANCHLNMLLISSNKEYLHTLKCSINGYNYSGVFDTGSVGVIIKKTIMEQLKLKAKQSHIILNGFGGKSVKILGEVAVYLEVNNVKRLVNALVVPDNAQSCGVIIGQTFINQVGVLLHHDVVEVFELSKDLN